MVRCEQFYEAMNKNSGFCEKSPETVQRILKHIDMRNRIESKASQSEVLKSGSCPIGQILSEGASRPLHALKNETDLEKALDLIIQKAEQKEMEDQSIAVGYKEVQQIVNQIVPQKVKTSTPEAAPVDVFVSVTGILQSAFKDDKIAESDIPVTIAKIDDLIRTLQTNKAALTQRLASVNTRVGNADLVGKQEQQERV